MSGLNSPLSGRVNSGFGGVGSHKSKIMFGVALIAVVPFMLSTFAAISCIVIRPDGLRQVS